MDTWLYLDVQNLTGNTTNEQPYFSVERDATGTPITNPIMRIFIFQRDCKYIRHGYSGIGIVVEFLNSKIKTEIVFPSS